jgi:hypothetical protein
MCKNGGAFRIEVVLDVQSDEVFTSTVPIK